MLHEPFYDPTKSYEKNYDEGPFGAFADGKKLEQTGEPQHIFHGYTVYAPFGIPPGPLLNSKFVKAAFEKGFDIAVYKTVRSRVFPCHPFPNVLSIHTSGNLTMEKLANPLIADASYGEPLSITNSFGVPSKDPDVWQEDAKKAIESEGKGQVMVLSFMGTVWPNQTAEEFIADYALAARLAKETGAKVLEANLSCPNIGNEGLVCYNMEATRRVCEAVRNEIGNTPFVIKIGYFADDAKLAELAHIANEYVDDVAAINTLQATVVNKKGEQALPGPNRAKSGVCGAGIAWAGIEMIQRLTAIKNANSYRFSITGVGGVMKSDDYHAYRTAGADTVMSATGAMWNPYLAQEIKQTL